MTSQEEVGLAVQYDYECKKDEYRGKGWYYFSKGNVNVWRCGQIRNRKWVLKWVHARLVDGKYVDHRYYPVDCLEEALTRDRYTITI